MGDAVSESIDAEFTKRVKDDMLFEIELTTFNF